MPSGRQSEALRGKAMSENGVYTKADLLNFRPKHDTFVGIDSDGCVFDTMEIKQKQCFHSEIIRHWRLEPIAAHVREAAEFVNLYSKKRGRNRFLSLVDTIDLLKERPEVLSSGVELPAFSSLRRFIDSGVVLGNPSLEKAVAETGDEDLSSVLEWSLTVNARVAEVVQHVPPFKWVRESLEKIRESSDAIVVSQTPEEALAREWRESGMDGYVSVIAGQELGTKTEHLAMATAERYPSENVLMIGDAPGDRKAAEANGALFFAVNPGREERSWECFFKEAYDKFLTHEYAGAYQDRLIEAFESLLPETPPWKT